MAAAAASLATDSPEAPLLLQRPFGHSPKPAPPPPPFTRFFRVITLRAHELHERVVPVTAMQQQGAPMAPSVPQGPQGAPMAQPSPNDGARQMGFVQVETAMQMLEQALPTLGSNTPEGEAVLRAMTLLAKPFKRQQAQDLVPAQIAEMARAQRQPPIAQMMSGAPAGAAPMPA